MATARSHWITLTAATCALTFPTPVAGKRFILGLGQDATGGRLVTWDASVRWTGGVVPTLTATALRADYFEFVCVDDATWVGSVYQQNVTYAASVGTAPFVTSVTPGTPRNNFTGRIGFRIVVGATPITVYALGRWVVPGNANSHLVEIINNGTWTTVASATVPAGGTAGAFRWVDLASPAALSASTSYLFVSTETSGGDQFYDSSTTIGFTSVATVPFPVFSSGGGFADDGSTGGNTKASGPVNFKYL